MKKANSINKDVDPLMDSPVVTVGFDGRCPFKTDPFKTDHS